MNKYLKYSLRAIIIGVPLKYCFVDRVVHLVKHHDFNCTNCIISTLPIILIVVILIAVVIAFLNIYWDEIWSDEDE